jgi:site-specific DNA-methyltransferase (adenine-specific)
VQKVEIGNATLYCGDCLKILPTLEKVDSVVTDPPYGIGIDRFDTAIDIDSFFERAHAVLNDDSFILFFSQMPKSVEWCSAASKLFKYSDHIVWAKRIVTAIALPINRSHESIFVYKKGKPKYAVTKDSYVNVRVPHMFTMPEYITGIQRHISMLHIELKKGEKGTIKPETKSNEVYAYMKIRSERAPEDVNITNIWSFLPENCQNKSASARIQHATVKPLNLMMRGVGLVSNAGSTVLDPFMGSGTTGVAAVQMGRKFIGIELDPDYFKIACKRIEDAQRQGDFFLEKTA